MRCPICLLPPLGLFAVLAENAAQGNWTARGTFTTTRAAFETAKMRVQGLQFHVVDDEGNMLQEMAA